MNDIIQINASKARNEFFRILEEVYLKDKIFLVKKAGIPLVDIVKTGKYKPAGSELSSEDVLLNLDLVRRLAGSVTVPKKYQGLSMDQMIEKARKERFQK